MKVVIGLLVIVAGAALGIYVGGWLCFVGGIVQVIETIKAPEIEAIGIALGIVRIVCAAFLGWVSFMICAVIGIALIR